MSGVGMHWVPSTTLGRWEEVEGASNQRPHGPIGNSGQCPRSWASFIAPNAPSLQGQMPSVGYWDTLHPHGGRARPTPPRSQSWHCLPVLGLTEAHWGPGQIGEG